MKITNKVFKGIIFGLIIAWIITLAFLCVVKSKSTVEKVNIFEVEHSVKIVRKWPTEYPRVRERVVAQIDDKAFEQERPDISKAQSFIQNYRQGDSTIVPYVYKFYEGDVRKGKLALAICGTETAFGTVGYGTGGYNCWGWMTEMGWTSWEESISDYIRRADSRYLSKFDGTVQSIVRIADAGYHPVDDKSQLKWAKVVMSFYNQL